VEMGMAHFFPRMGSLFLITSGSSRKFRSHRRATVSKKFTLYRTRDFCSILMPRGLAGVGLREPGFGES
jgi:hypothetical protein